MRGKTMQGTDLGLFHLLKCRPGPFAHLFSREVITGTKDCDQVIVLLGQMKELRAKPLLHFSGGFVGEGERHDLRDDQWVRLSQEEVEDAIDEDRGLASPGSCNHRSMPA